VTSDDGESATILVVEDELPLLKLVTRVLTRAGHEVIQARDGDAGVAEFREHHAGIDAVMLDVIIPPNGVGEVLDAILATNADVPIILTSGDVLSPELSKRLDACRGAFLAKPYVPKTLLRVLDEVMAGAASSAT